MKISTLLKIYAAPFRIISFFVMLVFILPQSAEAQITLGNGGSPDDLATLITGDGVQILNPQIICADSAFGTYSVTNITNFPTGEGLILSTGNIADSPGPNLSSVTSTEWTTPGDPLISFIAGASSFDACVFEFDIVPVGDTLRFNFTFASEEYPEYVGTPFNDAFGFFISGPGITGTPGLNGAENIALIPGTSVPVGINTVNNGNPSIGFPAVNPAFFVANPLSFTSLIEYDGWTTGLFAERAVSPCDTFHLKLAIADVADREWDSSVFIEKIQSNNLRVNSITAGGIENMVEGCNEGTVIFSRTPVTDEPVSVTYFVAGTATNGVDYPLIGTDPNPNVPKTIIIPANQESVSIAITPFSDGIDEGEEYIAFYLGNPDCPGTIQDSLIFTIQDSLNIAVIPALSFVCLGDSITFEVEGDGATYSWSPATYLDDPNIQNPTATPTENITYTVSTFASTCISSASVEVVVTDMSLSTDITNVFCLGQNTGAIALTPIGGQSPIEYEWTGPNGFTSVNQNISNLAPGTYTVLVTDRDGCIATTSVTITELPSMTATISSQTFIGGFNVSCFGAANGQASVVVQGGTPPYTYLWDDSSTQETQTATGLSANGYSVIISDANGCEIVESITLTEPTPVVGSLEERVDVLCFGDNTGSITISASGGVPPYTYLWNSMPPQTGTTATNLSAGLYVVSISDVNGCVGTVEVEIEEPESALSATVEVSNPGCDGEVTGSAMATVTGGTSPYTYGWSSNPALNQDNITGLGTGSYTLLITDDNACTLSIPFNILAPAPIVINTVSITDVLCFGAETGGANVQASGGTGPFTYTWNTIPVTIGNTIVNEPTGSYTVTVTDANGCVETADVTISQPAEAIAISTINQEDINCYGESNGSISVDASGGTGPYTYSWNTIPPTSGPLLENVGAGSYTVTVTDANNCVSSGNFILTQPDELLISATNVQHVLCSGAETGQVTASVSGGVPNYTYSWNDPANQITATATDLAAGTYVVTVTDENNCIATLEVTINEPEFPLGGQILSTTDVACFGDGTGAATVAGTGGSGSYSYLWNDANSQQTSTATGLTPGNYTVTITDNNGCNVPVILDVIIDGPLDAMLLQITPSVFPGGFNVICSGDSTATIDLEISGGTAPYTILWNLPGLETSTDEDLSDLAPGTYSVTVTDDNGCEETLSITLTAPSPIEIEAETTQSDCFGIPTGTINLSISGGVPGYAVDWQGPNGFTSTDVNLVDLEGGIYDLTITDASGCVYIDVVTVIQPEDLVITVDSLSDYNGFNTTCWYSQDGAIYITPSGGALPYSYQWNRPNNPNFSNQQDVTNVPAATIEVVLIDGNGCVQNEIIELTAPDTIDVDFDLSIFPNGFNISCFGASDGSIEAIASGGTPGYNYIWIGPAGYGPEFANPVENLIAGEYSVLIQDANGCSYAESVELTQPNPFAINLIAEEINGNNISCEGSSDGIINLIINGGAAPFDIDWTGPDGFSSSTEDLLALEAGEYCVTVTDNNDCVQQLCITLTEPEELIADIQPGFYLNGQNLNCVNSNDGFINTTITGGTTGYQISWTGPGNFTSSSANISGLAGGTYCLQVTDANGCTYEECTELIAPDPIEIILESSFDILCAGDGNASITATILGGDPAYVYSWSGPNGFSAITQNISDLEPGTYCLEITDMNNCTSDGCIVITTPLPLSGNLITSTFNGGVEIGCAGDNTGSIQALITGGTAPYTYLWSGPDGYAATTSTIENLESGTYCLEVTDANDCIFNACTDISEPAPLVAAPTVTIPDCNTGDPASVSLNVSGGIPTYTYNWSTNENTSTVLLEDGNHSVIITDANNCTITEVFNIVLLSNISVVLQSPVVPGGFNIACPDGTTGSINTTVSGSTGALTIMWTGPDGFTSNDLNISNLSAGTYCLEITDEAGCTDTECITLTAPEETVVILNVTGITCNGNNNAGISASTMGGVPVFGAWTGPDGFMGSGPSIVSLAPGTYCFTQSDVFGCTFSEICIDIIDIPVITINLSSPETDGINIACFGDDTGLINSNVTGGTMPYAYSWTGPGNYTSSEINPADLEAGEYCLTITDENMCTATECITLTQAEGIAVSADISSYAGGFNTTCVNVCDGAIEVTLVGGAEPVNISWTGPDGFVSGDAAISSLCAGTYTLLLEDNNGCVQSISYSIVAPDPIVITLSSPTFNGGTQIACAGDVTGTINTVISGGAPAFSFDWSGPGGFSSNEQNPQDLAVGIYEVTVMDGSGCISFASIELIEPDMPLFASATAEHVSCLDGSDGSIATTVEGGISPYSFEWSGPDGYESEDQNPSDLLAGDYTLVIEDANSCVFTVNIQITEPETGILHSLNVISELSCPGSTNGSLEVIPSGGSPDYTILWIGSNEFLSNEFEIDNLPAGTYTYVVTDANGCNASGAYILQDPLAIEINADIISTACAGATGSINLAVTGGTQPYDYLWSNGQLTANISNLQAGDYTVMVSDENGCQQSAEFTVGAENSLEINVDITEPACFGDYGGTLSASPVQGLEPVSYSWTGPNGYAETGEFIQNLLAGTYEVTATDQNGCEVNATYEIGQPEELSITPLETIIYSNGYNINTYGGNDGFLDNPSISGGTSPYALYWTGPNNFNTQGPGPFTGLTAGRYQLIVIDQNDCADTASITLTEPIPIEIPNGISPNGDGFNDNLQVRGIERFSQNKVMIYNRWGNLVHEETNYSNNTPWAGLNESGELLPEGTYFVIVELPDWDNLRGYLELRR